MDDVFLKHEQILYSDGDPAEYIYFVKSGQIEISTEKLAITENPWQKVKQDVELKRKFTG